MTAASVLFGANLYPAQGEAARRQSTAMSVLAELSPLPPINLQFADRGDFCEFPGFETHAVLRQDSVTITGHQGHRKSIVSEMFTNLAQIAADRNVRYFGFTNTDIIFTAAAIERIQRGDHQAYVFGRVDFEPSQEENVRPMIYGTDVFVVEAQWWLANQRRFRPYIVGEGCWDNVYTAQLLCWAGGELLNREPMIRHESHAAVWRKSPFGEHNGYLAAVDRMYFSRWAEYVAQLEALRGPTRQPAEQQAELRLQRAAFQEWQPGPFDHCLQWARMVKLMARRGAQIASQSWGRASC